MLPGKNPGKMLVLLGDDVAQFERAGGLPKIVTVRLPHRHSRRSPVHPPLRKLRHIYTRAFSLMQEIGRILTVEGQRPVSSGAETPQETPQSGGRTRFAEAIFSTAMIVPVRGSGAGWFQTHEYS